MNKLTNSRGFTILELLIATSVFSVILLLCTAGLLLIGRLYYKGITSSATQNVARNVMQHITEDFELSGGYFKQLPSTPSGYDGFCIGSNLYTYKIDQKINNDGTGHAFVVRNVPGCDTNSAQTPDDFVSSPPAVQAEWSEFLGPNMRLGSLTIAPPAGSATPPQSVSISLNIITGDDDLISAGLCKGGAGAQFCANSPLSSYAVRRLR